MRTAIIISGQVKRLKEDAQSVIDNLIKPYQADVFINVWSPDHLRLPEYTMRKPEDPSIDDLIGLYNPMVLEIESPRAAHIASEMATLPDHLYHIDGAIASGSKVANCWGMFYRIWRGNEMRKVYEQANGITYDCVIRYRFEIGASQPCPIIEPEPNTIHIPEGQDHCNGLCDTTAIGDGPSMNVYAGIYNKLREYTANKLATHQESAVRKHLELNGVNVKRFRWGTTLRGRSWNPSY